MAEYLTPNIREMRSAEIISYVYLQPMGDGHPMPCRPRGGCTWEQSEQNQAL